jgi:hypothetical protein
MSDCIAWTGQIRVQGYGCKYVGQGKRVAAHRWAWEQVYGPIPDGMVLDHTCHSKAVLKGECAGGWSCAHRRCVNIDHLELVTGKENNRRGANIIENRPTCKKGHSYTNPHNIMVRANGKRECAQCNRERSSMNWKLRKKV